MEEVTSVEDLERVARSLLEARPPRTDRATLITLSGELGAGKTTFTQTLARQLGVDGSVTSPTFVLMKIYALPEGTGFKRLVHIDAYRLEGGKDLAPLGFDEVMEDPGNLVVLEWPEKVVDGLPEADAALTLTVSSETTRTLSYA